MIRKHLYDEKGVEKIRCEAKILSSLQHQNIVEFYKVMINRCMNQKDF